MISLTEKKLNSYLNQAQYIINKNNQKGSEQVDNSNSALGGSSTKDPFQISNSISQNQDGENSAKHQVTTSNHSSSIVFSTGNSTKNQKTKAARTSALPSTSSNNKVKSKIQVNSGKKYVEDRK